MLSEKRPSRRARHNVLLVLAVIAGAATADDRVSAGLHACSAVTDETERLNCFDALAAAVAHDAPPPAVVAPTAAGAAPAPLTDDVGKGQTDEAGAAPETYTGAVTRCEKSSATNRWYFYFDNGQVWRQSNSGRLNFRDCVFDVTLERDLFGFKMTIPSEDRTVRVARVE